VPSGGLRTKGITKQSQVLVTVITVVYNGKESLEKTILSVINQTYANIEYIIVDGSSTDGTLDIIRKYENRIDYWVSESDEGIYDAMNKGISLATGEWINFMNSGDKFHDDGMITDVLERFNGCDIFYGNYIKNGEKCYPPKKINRLFFLMERMVCHQAIFEKKSLLLKFPFDTNYKIVADRKHLMECYMIAHADIIYVPHIICFYDDYGLSSDKSEFEKNSLKLVREYFGLLGLFFARTKRIVGTFFVLLRSKCNEYVN